MRINYNVSAMIANNALQNNDNSLSASLERLSSGLKINHGKDNPAGLAMGKRMNAQLEGLSVATQNASNGISVIETADGALSEMHDILQRINELAVKANNGTLSNDDRTIINDEVKQLKEELTRIKETTEFNSMSILDGEFEYRGYTSNKNIKVSYYAEEMNTAEDYLIDSLKVTGWQGDKITDVSMTATSDAKLRDAKVKSVKDNMVTIETKEGYELDLEISRLEKYDIESVELVRDAAGNITNASFTSADPKLAAATTSYDAGTGEYTITATDGTELVIDLSSVDADVNKIEDPAVKVSVSTATLEVSNLSVDLTGIGAMRLQVGANEGQVLEIPIPDVSLRHMGIDEIDVSTYEGANDCLSRIGSAISYLSSVRSKLGAYQNRLENSVDNLDVTYENMTASYSRIMDVDMAEEMSEYTKNQILTQAGTSMLAQANDRPSQILQLLQ